MYIKNKVVGITSPNLKKSKESGGEPDTCSVRAAENVSV